jgi:hypothetical protein
VCQVTFSTLPIFLLFLAGSSSATADLCDDYARVVDQHIATMRSIGQQAEAVNDARSAPDVVRRAQSEKLDWQNALTPINRELSQHYGGGDRLSASRSTMGWLCFFGKKF